ncbi:MAG: BPSL0761 family protein [Pseudomonadota bacterium]
MSTVRSERHLRRRRLFRAPRTHGRVTRPTTTPDERTRAVVHTAEFLRDLTKPTVTPGVPRAVREEARRLLRHYPCRADMSLVHAVMPQWFGRLPESLRRFGQTPTAVGGVGR